MSESFLNLTYVGRNESNVIGKCPRCHGSSIKTGTGLFWDIYFSGDKEVDVYNCSDCCYIEHIPTYPSIRDEVSDRWNIKKMGGGDCDKKISIRNNRESIEG